MEDLEFWKDINNIKKSFDYQPCKEDVICINGSVKYMEFSFEVLNSSRLSYSFIEFTYGIDEIHYYYPVNKNKTILDEITEYVLFFNIDKVKPESIKYIVNIFAFISNFKVCIGRGRLLLCDYDIYYGPLNYNDINNLKSFEIDTLLNDNEILKKPSLIINNFYPFTNCSYKYLIIIDKINRLKERISIYPNDYYQAMFYETNKKLHALNRPENIQNTNIYLNIYFDFPSEIQSLLNSVGINYRFCYDPLYFTGRSCTVCFDWKTDIFLINYIANVLNIIFVDNNWAKRYWKIPPSLLIRIAFGQLIKNELIYFGGLDKHITNISVPIPFKELEKINTENFINSTLFNLFPPETTDNNLFKKCSIYRLPVEEDAQSFKRYGGYNGWSDEDIDNIFDGRIDATWNLD